MHRPLRSALPALALALCASCAAPTIAVEPRLVTLKLDGEVKATSGASTASNSLDRVGLTDDQGAFGARVDAKWLSPHLTVSGFQSSHGGNGVLEADVSQGGITITAGTKVASDLDLGILNSLVTFDLAPTDALEAGLGLGVSLFDVDVGIRDKTTGDDVSSAEAFGLPVLAGRLGGKLGPIELEALLSGLSAKVDTDSVGFHDFDLSARMRVLGKGDHATGMVVIGYRDIELDLNYDDSGTAVDSTIGLSGPYVGLRLRF